MTRLAPLLAFDAGAGVVAAGGVGLAIRAHRAILRDGDAAASAYGVRIAGTMIAALAGAGIAFATMYQLSMP